MFFFPMFLDGLGALGGGISKSAPYFPIFPPYFERLWGLESKVNLQITVDTPNISVYGLLTDI